MKPTTAAAMATALETLAQALREEAKDQRPQVARKLAVVAEERGYSVSTLSELCRSHAVEAERRGRGRGHWYLTDAALDVYERKRTQPARLVGLRSTG